MRTALVLVDIQNDYFPGGRMELEGPMEAAAHARRLLEGFRRSGAPLVHVRHVSLHPGATFFLPDTDGADIHESVRPLEGEPVVVKHFPNAFRETTLLEVLRGAGATRLVLCGMMTHMCIDATTRAARDLGFECLLAHDACATRALEFGGVAVPAAQVHRAFLAALGAAYAKVLTADEALEHALSEPAT